MRKITLKEWIAGVEIAVGDGKNCFSMSRGSFHYRKKTFSKRKLLRTGARERDGKVIVNFLDRRTGGKACLMIKEARPGLYHLRLKTSLPGEPNRFWITFPTEMEEHFYGCGETYSAFDLKGQRVRIWVAEHQNTSRIARKIVRGTLSGGAEKKPDPVDRYESYYAQPTFVSSREYFVHVRTDEYCEFDFRKPGSVVLALQERPDFYIGRADSFEDLARLQSSLLGRQRELPDWIYDGVILAVQGGTDRVEEKLKKAVKAGTEVNGVWCQDWCGCRRTGFGYQVMWNWKWDRELYPELDLKIAEWKKQGIHFLGYINPFLALEGSLYRKASAAGYCVKNKNGEDYQVTITTFPAAMVDFTNPEAWEWYKNIIKKNLIGLGLSGWMADFGEYLPVDAVLFSGEDPYRMHNQWPALWAELNRQAVAESGKEGEVFFFTRAGYTGTVRASDMMWTGDHHVDWSEDDGLPSVIPATLSLAMSGFGICHSDAGGYTTILKMTRDKELLLRWEEMNVFSPLFRTHEGNQPDKNVQFDQDSDLLAQLARCSRMHVLLKPYLRELVREEADDGIPVMRPLFYYYDEPQAYTEKGEYLLGRDLLVVPVCAQGAEEKICYLPKDRWVHVFSGRETSGGRVRVEAPVGRPPVFVRRGSRWEELLMKLGEIPDSRS